MTSNDDIAKLVTIQFIFTITLITIWGIKLSW